MTAQEALFNELIQWMDSEAEVDALIDAYAHALAETIRADASLREAEGETYLAAYGLELAGLIDPRGDRVTGNRKQLRITVVIDFAGDYYESGELPRVVQGWIDAALDDRNDVAGWDYPAVAVVPGKGAAK